MQVTKPFLLLPLQPLLASAFIASSSAISKPYTYCVHSVIFATGHCLFINMMQRHWCDTSWLAGLKIKSCTNISKWFSFLNNETWFMHLVEWHFPCYTFFQLIHSFILYFMPGVRWPDCFCVQFQFRFTLVAFTCRKVMCAGPVKWCNVIWCTNNSGTGLRASEVQCGPADTSY